MQKKWGNSLAGGSEVKRSYPPMWKKQVHVLEEIVEPEKKRTLVSFVDPEARFGRKRTAARGKRSVLSTRSGPRYI